MCNASLKSDKASNWNLGKLTSSIMSARPAENIRTGTLLLCKYQIISEVVKS